MNLRSIILTLSLIFWGGFALAQDAFDGAWRVVSNDGAEVIALMLDQSGTDISGTGILGPAFDRFAGAEARVTAGAALDRNMELELSVAPLGAALGNTTMRIFVIEDLGATVLFEGQVISAMLEADERPGTDVTTTPEIVETGDICADMTTLQQVMFLQADDALRRELERLYDGADTQYGIDASEPRCRYLFEQLTRLQGGETVGTTPTDTAGLGVRPLGASEVCDDVAPLVAQIRAEEAAAGLSDDGSVQSILNDSGLGVDGVWSTGACEFGLANLREYLELISVSTLGQPVVPGNTVKDPNGQGTVTGGDLFELFFQVRDVSETLNVRAGPSTNNAVVGQLPYFARDLRILSPGCMPAIGGAEFGRLPLGAQLEQLSGRWCLIRWNGIEGWVAGRYLRPM